VRNIKDISSQPARSEWVDTMKFLGIFAIYLGHLGKSSGKLFLFVFQYHVPMFFLISGFFSSSSLNLSISENFKKKIKTILIPYAIFCCMNIIMMTINQDSGIRVLLSMFKQSVFGIRNQLFAGALWFLPCLFVISVSVDGMSRILKKYVGSRYIYYILVIAIIFYIIARLFLSPPQWIFNIDSAMQYMIYYAIGAMIFPWIKNKNFKQLNAKNKAIFLSLTLMALIVTGLGYFKGTGYLINLLPFSLPDYINMFVPIIRALIIIWINIILAKILTRIQLLPRMGQETLIFCGTEQIIKITVSSILTMFGLSIKITTPYIACIYTMFILVLSHFALVPFLNKYFSVFSGKYSWTNKFREKTSPSNLQ